MEGFAAVGVSTWDEGGWFNIEGIGIHWLIKRIYLKNVKSNYVMKHCNIGSITKLKLINNIKWYGKGIKVL